MKSIELVAILVATSDLQNFFWCPCEHPRSLEEAEKVPCTLLRARARPQNRTTAYLQWILWPRGLLHRKYALVRAVARDTANMQSIGLASIYGAPSDDLASENCFFKKASQLRRFLFGRVSALIDVATRHRKYAVNRVGEPLRSMLCFSEFWQKRAKVLL